MRVVHGDELDAGIEAQGSPRTLENGEAHQNPAEGR
jgi:hypothetical protein